MTKLPRRPTPSKRRPTKRRLSYAAQWDADAARERLELERFADRWNAQARAAGNPNA